MKTVKILLFLLLAGTVTATAQEKTINLEKSVVKWTGTKIAGSHNGKVAIQGGYFTFENGQITNGRVAMDMSTITDDDLSNETYNQKLVNHLKSDDFFGVKKFPTATFVVTEASAFKNGEASVSGVLTIKSKSEKITFEMLQKDNVYSAHLDIDRSKFDVRYGSSSFFDNLGDKVIDNIFNLNIELVFE